ncbi:MAG: DegV family protein [Lachnospiraceae bacterium]|nr:DegV family protein [Lachnospiraceae bacterium]
MADYIVTCCSTADLSKEHFDKRDLKVIYFHYEVDGVEYLDDCGKSMAPEELFRRMNEGAMTRTSQVSVGEYNACWREYLDQGKDILHVCLSSGISGTYQSAKIACDMLKAEYPDRTIHVVDSLAASSGYGLLMDAIADKRDEGMSLEELYQWSEENKLRLHHWFFTSDLTFFIRGGRVSKTAGMIGKVLNICPLLNVDYKGALTPREKIRGKKAVIRRTFEKMKEHVENGMDYTGKCYMSHSLCLEDAQMLAQMIEEAFTGLNGKVEINPIGATIGSHTGPGTVALFFWGDKRED